MKNINEEQKEHFESCLYRIEEEGIDYCFDGYSNWTEIQDEIFHELRSNYLRAKEILELYVRNLVE